MTSSIRCSTNFFESSSPLAAWACLLRFLSCCLGSGHWASTPCIFWLRLLQLWLLPIDLLTQLRGPRLILHNLWVHVRVAYLVLMLLVHLLLCVVPLLSGCVGRLISCNVSTNLIIGKSLLLCHLLVIHCIVLRRTAEVSIAMLLASKVILLLICVPLWAHDTWLASVLCSRWVLSPFIIFWSIRWPVDPIS